MRRFVSFLPALVVMIVALVVLSLVPSVVYRVQAASTQAKLTLVRQAVDSDDILERLNAAIRNVAETVTPSVVHIEVIDEAGGMRSARGSSGAGWVYDTAGHVVTNAHVVDGASEVWLQFHDGRRSRAEVLGSDTFTDVAVLKVSADVPVFPVRRATSQEVSVGDRVFAFGSPFGFKFSMSEGIVSGLGRAARASRVFGFSNYIQTDAAVNPGNSGGPLVDIRGRVVGMNVAIATARSSQGTSVEGQSAGISFAIPLATVEAVVSQLIGSGQVARGFLGISFQGEDEIYDNANQFRGVGVRVQQVTDDGPSRRAGMRRGDVIVAINDRKTPTSEVLRSLVSNSRPGDEVSVRVWRNNEFETLAVTLGSMPASALANRQMIREPGLFLESSPDGLRIGAVQDGSAAERAGLRVGQIVLEVGGEPISQMREFFSTLSDRKFYEDKEVTVKIREGTPPDLIERTVTLKLTP
jgi:serine protease Do